MRTIAPSSHLISELLRRHREHSEATQGSGTLPNSADPWIASLHSQ